MKLKTKAAIVGLLMVPTVTLGARNLRGGGEFINHPGDADASYTVSAHANNANSENVAWKWSVLALADTTSFTVYFNAAFTDSVTIHCPPGVGYNQSDIRDWPAWKFKIVKASTAGYAKITMRWE